MGSLIIAANWKMHKTVQEAVDFSREVLRKLDSKNEVIIFPPCPLIPAVQAVLGKTRVLIGAQDCHQEEKGAFTGDVSASMLKSIGCSIILAGHSERRQHHNETNGIINKKIMAALRNGLQVMLCIGEGKAERQKGCTFAVLEKQLRECISGLSGKDLARIIIAYEPVWAIGTGNTASPQQAQEAHAFIRKTLASLFGKKAATHLKILYGGSVTQENAAGLFKEEDIDGALVGGASLDAERFLQIVNAG